MDPISEHGIIDFHTHIFPDSIASNTISLLESKAKIKASTDGTREQLLKILNKHSPEKILFATDTPWSSAESEIRAVQELPVEASVKEGILWKNAERLLTKNEKNR